MPHLSLAVSERVVAVTVLRAMVARGLAVLPLLDAPATSPDCVGATDILDDAVSCVPLVLQHDGR